MRAKLCLSLVAFGQLCAVAMAQVQPSAVISQSNADSTIYVTHVTVIDTKTGKEAEGRTVVISGDRISEVKDSKGIKTTCGCEGRGRHRQVSDSGAVGHACA